MINGQCIDLTQFLEFVFSFVNALIPCVASLIGLLVGFWVFGMLIPTNFKPWGK